MLCNCSSLLNNITVSVAEHTDNRPVPTATEAADCHHILTDIASCQTTDTNRHSFAHNILCRHHL